MAQSKLRETVEKIMTPGKGILAADESFPSVKKKLAKVGLESTEATRRAYRDMLFTSPEMEHSISGVILFDETIRQKSVAGKPFVDVLSEKGVVPGIKVDGGAKAMPHFPGEKITEGLDGLPARVEEYVSLGARFAKWRAVITIGEAIPSRACLESNADALARYAAICQEGGLVPIVEPEVLMDGPHDIDRCDEVTGETLSIVFDRLHRHRVRLEEMLLKPNMVISGSECPTQADVDEVARRTVACFLRHVPAAVPGIVFLSGGQSSELATAHLSRMNERSADLPWPLSFSYGRALQDDALHAWKGEQANLDAAQAIFRERARLNGLATKGEYKPEMEGAAA